VILLRIIPFACTVGVVGRNVDENLVARTICWFIVAGIKWIQQFGSLFLILSKLEKNFTEIFLFLLKIVDYYMFERRSICFS
jgi:hypothetical protein